MGLETPNPKLVKRFNQGFSEGYEQFVSSRAQRTNFQLAYQLYQEKRAIIELQMDGPHTVLIFANRNQSFLLNDIFGVLAAHRIVVLGLSLHGRIRAPMLVFARLVLSQRGQPLSPQTSESLDYALRGALDAQFSVEGMFSPVFSLDGQLDRVSTTFAIDPLLHLPALSIEARLHDPEQQTALCYKIAHALWQEDLIAINADLQVWRSQSRMILHLLGPNATQIPEYLGQKIAESVQQRLLG
ncbi:hypothetical protein KR51_00020740 [Rubidibacter lacunae KORDI 51-2]|uniref:Uncharacterized protein n=1 Tax=Rubidibacter lacunae KORDI 51-2 TaxID=582515 RepID=U5DKQ7_9CHRO|nr:hypothetical protein [Rubidibacter lacunae]ERN41497.1 hypothetical protein KR51_00020740 [Rubidibacter lacunae KORDI 51-2]